MERGWIKIYESADAAMSELMRQRLEENNIYEVLLSRKDGGLGVGITELYVQESNKEAALKIVK
ncbi:MAG: DUF2007 domain-containing protein [Prevotellaceae bacterium]|jgi:hypothetical protein|nr:DUF2007 domain-containing protein [Prevotellaceae bacterium]